MFEDAAVREIAESFYDPSLPYHNFDHVRYVLSSAETLLGKCQNEQISVDEKVVYYAILFHDAGYADDHEALGYESKEAYSAGLAEQTLLECDIDEATIDKVIQAILCTHLTGRCANNEDKAVKSSDLSGLAADYSVFKDNSIKLMQEYELLSGDGLQWDRWKKMAADRLELYFKDDFSLTDDNAENAVFLNAARENIQRMQADQQ